MSLSGNRARSSATLGTQRSKNFWPPRPVRVRSMSDGCIPPKHRKGFHEPGYTVITRSMSAASPTSSVIAVEGVSGEMAAPAFILRSWMA